jgi:hypothetical protein
MFHKIPDTVIKYIKTSHFSIQLINKYQANIRDAIGTLTLKYMQRIGILTLKYKFYFKRNWSMPFYKLFITISTY